MHSGPVQVRFYDERVTVLCPLGHVVTSSPTGPEFAGSFLAARIGAHQVRRDWVVECDGAVTSDPRDALAGAGAGSAAYLTPDGTDFESLTDYQARKEPGE